MCDACNSWDKFIANTFGSTFVTESCLVVCCSTKFGLVTALWPIGSHFETRHCYVQFFTQHHLALTLSRSDFLQNRRLGTISVCSLLPALRRDNAVCSWMCVACNSWDLLEHFPTRKRWVQKNAANHMIGPRRRFRMWKWRSQEVVNFNTQKTKKKTTHQCVHNHGIAIRLAWLDPVKSVGCAVIHLKVDTLADGAHAPSWAGHPPQKRDKGNVRMLGAWFASGSSRITVPSLANV